MQCCNNTFVPPFQFELPYIKSIFGIGIKRYNEFSDDFMFYNKDGFSCDCSDIKEIKRFLQDYAYIIRDASLYECKEDQGKHKKALYNNKYKH